MKSRGVQLYWASNDSALLTGAWWTFVPTGLGLALIGFALTLINFGIDEVTNPRLELRADGERVIQAGVTPESRDSGDPGQGRDNAVLKVSNLNEYWTDRGKLRRSTI